MGSPLEDILSGALSKRAGSGGGAGEGGLAAALGGGGGMDGLVKMLLPALGGLLAGGGLSKILAGFQQNGMGGKAQSWVGTGENESVSGDEVRQALGQEELGNVASQLGLPEDQAAEVLAAALPDAVDQVTADGQVPDEQTVNQRLAPFSA
jgi:uncharacterized protein YidB (DUF937 family)